MKADVLGGVALKFLIAGCAAANLVFFSTSAVVLGAWIVFDVFLMATFAFCCPWLRHVTIGMAGASLPVVGVLLYFAASDEGRALRPILSASVCFEIIASIAVIATASAPAVRDTTFPSLRLVQAPAVVTDEGRSPDDICGICHEPAQSVRGGVLRPCLCECKGTVGWRCEPCAYAELGVQRGVPLQWAVCMTCRAYLAPESRLRHDGCTGECSVHREAGECWCATCGTEFEPLVYYLCLRRVRLETGSTSSKSGDLYCTRCGVTVSHSVGQEFR